VGSKLRYSVRWGKVVLRALCYKHIHIVGGKVGKAVAVVPKAHVKQLGAVKGCGTILLYNVNMGLWQPPFVVGYKLPQVVPTLTEGYYNA
jgi:hypothetical protein